MTLRDETGDVELPRGFDEAWQAQAHAISQALLESGRIAPAPWSKTLGAAIRRRLADGDPDTTATYYRAMIDAIETVTGLEDAEMHAIVEQWRRAFESTPHGQPVELPDR